MPSAWESIHALEKIQSDGASPTQAALLAALKACARVRDLQSGKQIHAYIAARRSIDGGGVIDSEISGALVTMYAKCGSIADAREIFDSLEPRDRGVICWTAMILGYADNGDGDLALGFFRTMRQQSRDNFAAPNRVTYLAALKACAVAISSPGRAFSKVREIHREISQEGFEKDLFVASALVDLYWKCGSSLHAREMFDKMEQRSVVSWSSMVRGLAQAGDTTMALETFQRMTCAPNRVTYLAVLKAVAALAVEEEGEAVDGKVVKLKSLEKARLLHGQIRSSGFEHHASTASSLVDVYCKCGSVDEAWEVFQRIKRSFRDVVSWSAMILGYAQTGQAEIALDLFEKMESDGCAPNSATFVALLKACASQGLSGAGRRIHARICAAGFDTQDEVSTSLVDFYGKSGSTTRARQIFEAMACVDLVTWNTLLAGYSQQGEVTEVLLAFEGMIRASINPDSVTFLTVLTACSHGGLVQQGKLVFRTMTQRNITPGIEHYSCLVDLLGRANLLDEAVAVLAGVSATSRMWMSVLGACQRWRNVEIARVAYAKLLELDPGDSAAYVLMASILELQSDRCD